MPSPFDAVLEAPFGKLGVRVANGRVNGSLAVSRALGDHNLKGATGGVSCAPHVVSHTLQPTDRAVVLASDGLWDVVGEGEAQDAVLQALGATPLVPAAPPRPSVRYEQ